MRFHRRAPPFVAAHAAAGGKYPIDDVPAGNSAGARGLSLTASRYNS